MDKNIVDYILWKFVVVAGQNELLKITCMAIKWPSNFIIIIILKNDSNTYTIKGFTFPTSGVIERSSDKKQFHRIEKRPLPQ